ncbi:MAG: long-chain-fatty-acid--CoA ligase [Actinobacteria bacterium]|nr:long-chain-fatty-acid--CoA ligase [Actinomycetota bacterium]
MRISQTLARNAQVAPRDTATIFGDRRRTWPEHRDRVARLASALRRMGMGDGDRVAMLALNSDRYLEWYFAVSWGGGVVVPINIRLAPPEIVHWLTDSGASILFVDDTFLPVVPKLQEAVSTLRHVVHVGDGDPPEGTDGFEQLIADSDPIPASEGRGDDLAGLFYTGGTTGRSKGVMLSHNNLLSNAFHLVPAVGFGPQTVYLHVAPMFHLADAAGMYAVALAGATHTFVPAFAPAAVIEAIEAHRVTTTLLVPTMIAALTQVPDVEQRDLSSWEQLLYGGSPMSEALIDGILKLVPQLNLVQAYGQTEAAPVVTLLPPERHTFSGPLAGKTRSAGQAAFGVEVAILDEEDQEVPRETVGQICVRGDNVMIGYLDRPDETETALRNGWLHTGDAGYMDDDGFVFVVDRLKDMIVTGGENVYTAEVENALASHDAVLECAVIGIPSDEWGEQVHAIVRIAPDSDVSEAELLAHCKEQIANYKCPRSVDIRQDELPKSGAGKILKRELRAPFWEDQDRAVH